MKVAIVKETGMHPQLTAYKYGIGFRIFGPELCCQIASELIFSTTEEQALDALKKSVRKELGKTCEIIEIYDTEGV